MHKLGGTTFRPSVSRFICFNKRGERGRGKGESEAPARAIWTTHAAGS